MQVIPVIDLKGGQVVRARMGRRDEYQPIATPLAAGSDPVGVARGLLSLFEFRCLYVADLDAIEGRGGNQAALASLGSAFPALELWVDAGLNALGAARDFLARTPASLVIGSESQRDAAAHEALRGEPKVALSLDFRGDAFLGPPQILADAELWPSRVIAMTLARVGAGAGPDMARLASLRGRAGGRALYAAGGVRDFTDLAALAKAGIDGALVASCLHDGKLGAADIAKAAALDPARAIG